MIKAFVDELAADISARYHQYVEQFTVGLWSGSGFIEFRCGFALRHNSEPRSFTIKVPALDGETDDERRMLIVVVFEEIQDRLDAAISARAGVIN